MEYRIYVVDADDVDRFNTTFQEVKEQANYYLFDENLECLLKEYLKSVNDDVIDCTNCFHFLCDEEQGIILEF